MVASPSVNLYRHLQIGLLLCTCAVVTACGFQLRGYTPIPDSLSVLHLQANNRTETVRTLETLLRGNGVELVDNVDQAPYELKVLNESHRRRAVSLSSSAQTEEYELRSSLRFTIADQDQNILVPPTEVYTERVYRYDENNVNAKAEEEALLRREMQTNLAQQVIRRYLALAKQQSTP